MSTDNFNGAAELTAHNRARHDQEKALLTASFRKNANLVSRVNALNGISIERVKITAGEFIWGGADKQTPTQYHPLSYGVVVKATIGNAERVFTARLDMDGYYDISHTEGGEPVGNPVHTASQAKVTNELNAWVLDLGSKYGVDMIALGALVQRNKDVQERREAELAQRDRSPK